MKLSELIADLQAIQRKHADIRVLLYGLDNDEADLTHVAAEWSECHGRYALVLATDNYEPPAPERDEAPTHDVSKRWDGGLHNRPMTKHDCP